MTGISWKFIALFAISFAGALGYLYVTRVPADESKAAAAPTSNRNDVAQYTPAATLAAASSAASSTQSSIVAFSGDIVVKWANENTDARTRAADITALTTAPREQALPMLQRVLNAGADTDKQLALEALHNMALQQGDDDGSLRNVLRQAIYHGDDVNMVSNVQTVLDHIDSQIGSSDRR
ncbi:MAG: hypothetical protein QM808_07205 [Steroidobacteraceae bacterium]